MKYRKNSPLNRVLAMFLSIMMIIAMLPDSTFSVFAVTDEPMSASEQKTTVTVEVNVSGGDVSGGDVSGGDVSGGDVSGGDVSGGDVSGGDVSGGDVSGGDVSGGDVSITITQNDDSRSVSILRGTNLKVYVKPNDGYTVDTITVDSDAIRTISKDENGRYFTIADIQSNKKITVTFKEKAKAEVSDVTISTSKGARSSETDGSKLYVLKREGAVTFSTEKEGIRLSGDGGFVAGSETEKSVSVSEAKTITKIQLFYQADGELYADWHDVNTGKTEIVIDTEAPVAEFSLEPPANENGYHSSDITVEVTVTDEPKGAGIKCIEYAIDYQNDTGETVTGGWEQLQQYDSNDSENYQESYTGEITVDASSYNYQSVTVKVKTVDFADNEETFEKELHINSTDPSVTLEFLPDSPAPGAQEGYYNVPGKLQITVSDRKDTFDREAIADGLQITADGKDVMVEPDRISWSESGQKYIGTYTFEEDAHYECSSSYTNKAGRKASKTFYDFTIDQTAPIINVTFNDTPWNEKYYNKDRIATITINEANFYDGPDWYTKENLVIQVTRQLLNSSEETTTEMYPEFTKEGDVYTATVDFKENANYKFEITYTTDRAGNPATVSEYQKEFTINKESPKLSISYDNMESLNDFYYKDNRTATIRIVENTFRANEVEFTVSATDAAGRPVDLSSKAYDSYLKDQDHWNPDQTAQIPFDIEGNYQLNLKYVNLAGTPQEKEIEDSFCIDKSKPENLKITYEPDFIGVLLENLTFGFYRAPVNVTLEATDDYAGVDYFLYSYEVQEGASGTNTGRINVKTSESDITRDGTKASTKFTIPAQFRGSASFDVFDRSGNHERFADNQIIVVDDVAPGIRVTYDNNNAFYEKYYNQDRVATITIDEANFFEDDLTKDGLLVITVDKTTDAGVHSTENLLPKFSKNGDVYTCTVEFRENADYTLTIKYTDRSGNDAVISEYQSSFTIDKTPPTIKVSYDNNNSKNSNQFKEDRIATIEITEHNFKPSDVVAKVIGNGSEIESYADYLKKAENWTSNGDVHTAAIKYSDEAHYEFSIAYSDMAGLGNTPVDYTDSVAPTQFTLDKSVPTQMKIVIDDKSVLGTNNIGFDTFYNKTVSVKLSANCDISGLGSLKYQKVSSVSEYDINGQWINYNADTGIVVAPNEKFIIYFRAEDRAGNYAIVNSTGIVVDDKMPQGSDDASEIDISLTAPNGNGFYNGNVTVNLQVVEPKYTGQNVSGSGCYSGLKEITYRIHTTDMSADIQEAGTLFELGSQTGGAEFDGDRLVSSWSGSITIDANTFNSNNIIVEVTAVDNAGNTRVTTTKAGDIQIDVTPPRIDVSYDNNTADSNSFFKADRTATIVVTERNFDPRGVNVTITNTDGVIPSLSEWRQTSAGTENRDDTTWESTITYNADGDYTFEITYTDPADNPMSGVSYAEGTVAATSFTIDKTIPLIGVVYDNNSADPVNNNYYKAERTATITITEHNFDAGRINITLTATDDGKATTLPTVSGWTSNGNVHTATIRYAADALYSFDIAFNDMAGNAAADFAQQTFYVDKTNPTLEITGVANNSANKGEVIPVISYSDTNYDSSRVTITLSGANRGEIEQFDGSYSDIHNGRIFTFANFANEKQVDDIYTLSATLTDKAGNTTTQSITFSVNRFGSTYAISDNTKALNGNYVKAPQDIVLTEINADELNDITITLFKNNETITLKEGDDYRVGVTGGNGEWYQYTYTIFAKNFEDDGVYRISVHSKDAAGNIAENSLDTKNMEISFGVDKTAPTLVVINLENGVTYAVESITALMSANDNLQFNSIAVYLDNYDTPYKTWSAEEIAGILSGDGEFKFDILGNSTGAHKVRIVCTDAAGNETVEEITDFFVTTNIWVRYYNNKPLFFGTIGGVLLLVALIVVIVVLKRRKKEKQ